MTSSTRPKVLGFRSGQKMVTIKRVFNRFVVLARMLHVNLVKTFLDLDDVLSMALDI